MADQYNYGWRGLDPNLSIYNNPYSQSYGYEPKTEEKGNGVSPLLLALAAKKALAGKEAAAGVGSVTAGTEVAALPVAGEAGFVGPVAPSMLTSASSLGAAPLAGIAAGTILGGRSAYNMLTGKQKNWKDASLADNAGRVTLGIATGGLSELANALFGGHKSTRQVARGHTKELLKQGADNSKWQNYVNAMRGQYDSAPPDPTKPFAGKYKTFDEYKKAGLQAGDLTGVYGNLKTFGPDWSNLNFDQQKKVTQGIIDAGLYNSKKGEVEITDAAKAKDILAKAIAKKK